MDETFSHLDPDLEAALQAALKNMAMTILVIAHRASHLAFCDRVCELQNGRLLMPHDFDADFDIEGQTGLHNGGRASAVGLV